MSVPFQRDRLTWIAYELFAYFSYLQASLGGVMPFLREELQLSFTMGGLHFSAFAIGIILAGLVSSILVQQFGRSGVVWGGAIGMAVGAVGLILGQNSGTTLVSTTVMGLFGMMLAIVLQAVMSDYHGERRTVAITEMNVAASVGASLVPIAIAQLNRAGLGWRSALILAIVVLGGIAVQARSVEMPKLRIQDAAQAQFRLPKVFWLYWILVTLAVSIEFCVYFWGADFLSTALKFEKNTAVGWMSGYLISCFVGRVIGSQLSRSVASMRLLWIAIVLTAIGFPLLWLATIPALNLFGLLLAGFGIANFYPLIAAITLSRIAAADLAIARLSSGVGLAILIAPFVLGWIADQIALRQAFGLVLLLLIGLGLVFAILGRISDRS